MNQTLTLTRGLPGSGKSTWAQNALDSNTVRLERDLLRDQLFNSRKFIPENEEIITKVQFSMAKAAAEAGKNIIISDMNLRAAYVRNWAKFAAENGMRFDTVKFEVAIEECIRRDKERFHSVGEEVIRKNSRFVKKDGRIDDVDVSKEMSQTLKIEPYNNPADLPSAIIVDIDGTLATMADRSPYEWHRVGEDSPVAAVIHAVSAAYQNYDEIIVMSGRDASCRSITEDWLKTHLGKISNYQLHMRAEGDNRKDDLVKYELFNEHIRGKYHVKYVLDDRDQVVKMWRSLGLNCFQVAAGAF